jgi:DNA-binding transcriptional MerR regulator
MARTKRTRAGVADGMTARELAAKVGVTVRTLRFYTSEGVLQAPAFRGAATRYSREHLVRLAALRFLQRERRLRLPVIREYLKSVGPLEVARLATAFLPELAPPAPPEPRSTTAAEVVNVVADVPAVEAPVEVSDTWQRVTIAPGLEVHVHSTASVELKALAQGVVERIRAGRVP